MIIVIVIVIIITITIIIMVTLLIIIIIILMVMIMMILNFHDPFFARCQHGLVTANWLIVRPGAFWISSFMA